MMFGGRVEGRKLKGGYGNIYCCSDQITHLIKCFFHIYILKISLKTETFHIVQVLGVHFHSKIHQFKQK